jgi:hypothetical protein
MNLHLNFFSKKTKKITKIVEKENQVMSGSCWISLEASLTFQYGHGPRMWPGGIPKIRGL